MSFLENFQKLEEKQNQLEKNREERFQRIKEFLKSTEKEAKAGKNSKRPFILNREHVLTVFGFQSSTSFAESNYTCNINGGSLTQNTRETTRNRRAEKKAQEIISTIIDQESFSENPKLPTNIDQTRVIKKNPIPTPGSSKTDNDEFETEENKTIKAEEEEEENDFIPASEECGKKDQVIHCSEETLVSTSQENPAVQNKTCQTEEIENNLLSPPHVEDTDTDDSKDKKKDEGEKQKEEVPSITEESDSDNKTPSQATQNLDLAGKTDGTPEQVLSAPTSGNVKSNATPFQYLKRPLQGTPANKNSKVISSASKVLDKQKLALLEAEKKKKKEEEMKKIKQKVEEASKMKDEIIKSKIEELRRKREEKQQKVLATREVVERKKYENLLKLKKNKKEKEGQTKAEAEKLKEEQILKKKQLNLQKAQEVEERRQREDNARLARLKEQEEEQRRLAELKLRQQEEAEKLLQQRRLEEEARAKEAMKNVKPVTSKIKTTQNKVGGNNSYEITSNSNQKQGTSVDKDNYDIEDLQLEESEDEDHPRKMIPEWAKKSKRIEALKIDSYIPVSVISSYFRLEMPDMRKMFGEHAHKRVRTSSAVWLNPTNTE